MKKRIEWIDSIKFICMICIMIGHFEFFPQKLETFFSAFCLTGFLLCTGYTFHLEKSMMYFIKKRFKQINLLEKPLLLPFFDQFYLQHLIFLKPIAEQLIVAHHYLHLCDVQ